MLRSRLTASSGEPGSSHDADRVSFIDMRLKEIRSREEATKNEELLIPLAQESLSLTNERISLTSSAPAPAPAPAQGNYLHLIPMNNIELYPFIFLSVLYYVSDRVYLMR